MSYKVSVAIEFLDGTTIEHDDAKSCDLEEGFLYVGLGTVCHVYNTSTIARYVVAREDVQEPSNQD